MDEDPGMIYVRVSGIFEAKRGGEKCAGCDTGKHIHDAICCMSCFRRLPPTMQYTSEDFATRKRKARKWLRANKDGGQIEQALMGRMPSCGHVVALDVSATSKARREFAKRGYDTQTLPRAEAMVIFQRETALHREKCMTDRQVKGSADV